VARPSDANFIISGLAKIISPLFLLICVVGGMDACFAAGRYVGVSIPISYSDQAGCSGMVRQEIMAVQVANAPSADGLAVVLELLMAKLQELCLAELELCAPVARMLRDVYATCS